MFDSKTGQLTGQLRVHDRGVVPLKRKEALGWAESKALDSGKIEELFGKVAEAGDQTGAILLRVPQRPTDPRHPANKQGPGG